MSGVYGTFDVKKKFITFKDVNNCNHIVNIDFLVDVSRNEGDDMAYISLSNGSLFVVKKEECPSIISQINGRTLCE